RADRAASLDEGLTVLVFAGDVGARVQHIGEDAGRPAEHVVFEHHTFVDRDVVLNLHVVADLCPGHHHHVLTQAAALPDHGARHHVTEVPDLGVLADPGTCIDEARLVGEVVGHYPTTLTSSS